MTFCKYGTLAGRIHLRSGDTENFAFINYFSPTDAQAAANDMDGKWFDGVQIRVKVQDQTAPLSHQGNTCTVKVTNLSKHTTKNTLKDIFRCFHVSSVKVNQTDGNFNYAYVNFASPNDAEQAEKQLDGFKIDENVIRVRLHSSGEAAVGSPLPHGHFSPSFVKIPPVSSPSSHGTSTLPPTRPVGVHPVGSPVPHERFSTSPLFSPVTVHPVNYPVPHGTFSTTPPTRPVMAVSVPTVACHQSLSEFQRGYSSSALQSLPPARLSSVSTAPLQLPPRQFSSIQLALGLLHLLRRCKLHVTKPVNKTSIQYAPSFPGFRPAFHHLKYRN